MNRVLFIAYLFPPIANSGTQRPLKFAKYLSLYGWEPTVITAERFDDHPIDSSLLQELAPDQRVIRLPMLNHRIADGIATMTLGTGFGTKLAGALSWRLRRRFQVPDLFALWKPTATRAALGCIVSGASTPSMPRDSRGRRCSLGASFGGHRASPDRGFQDSWAGDALMAFLGDLARSGIGARAHRRDPGVGGRERLDLDDAVDEGGAPSSRSVEVHHHPQWI